MDAVTSKGGVTNAADLATNDPYFANQPLNVISSGTKIADISFLSGTELASVDFGRFGATGSQTFGFQFSKQNFAVGDYIASLAFECFNDSIALVGTAKPVPEPSAISGMLVGGLAMILQAKRKRQKSEA